MNRSSKQKKIKTKETNFLPAKTIRAGQKQKYIPPRAEKSMGMLSSAKAEKQKQIKAKKGSD